jgi:hypothetical protein
MRQGRIRRPNPPDNLSLACDTRQSCLPLTGVRTWGRRPQQQHVDANFYCNSKVQTLLYGDITGPPPPSVSSLTAADFAETTYAPPTSRCSRSCHTVLPFTREHPVSGYSAGRAECRVAQRSRTMSLKKVRRPVGLPRGRRASSCWRADT